MGFPGRAHRNAVRCRFSYLICGKIQAFEPLTKHYIFDLLSMDTTQKSRLLSPTQTPLNSTCHDHFIYQCTSAWVILKLNWPIMGIQASQIRGEVDQGFHMIKDWFVEERLDCAGRCVCSAIKGAERALKYTSERKQFGSRIMNFQGI
ncbi:MAG: hypothetical protein ACI845_001726 [Gammaproteobacteria bacterium]